MRKRLYVIIILSVFLIGCNSDLLGQKTPKRLAQEALLSELRDCDQKFGGNSYDDKRNANIQFCNDLLNTIRVLMEQGYYEGEEGEVNQVIQQVENFTTEYPPYGTGMIDPTPHFQDHVNQIIGDI